MVADPVKYRTLWSTKRVVTDDTTLHAVCRFRHATMDQTQGFGLGILLRVTYYIESPKAPDIARLFEKMNLKLGRGGRVRGMQQFEGVEVLVIDDSFAHVERPDQLSPKSRAIWDSVSEIADYVAYWVMPEDQREEYVARRFAALAMLTSPAITVDEAIRWGAPFSRQELHAFATDGAVRLDECVTAPLGAWLLVAFALRCYPMTFLTWLVHQLRDDEEVYSTALAWWADETDHQPVEALYQRCLDGQEASPMASFLIALHFYIESDRDEVINYVLDAMRQFGDGGAELQRELVVRLSEAWRQIDAR